MESGIMFEPYLKKISGPSYVCSSYPLQEDKIFRFGRSADADIVLKNTVFSRNHATLHYSKDTDTWSMKTHSVNASFLDGKPLTKGDSCQMCNGSVIIFPLDPIEASIKLQVLLKDEMPIKRRRTTDRGEESVSVNDYDTTIKVAQKCFQSRMNEEQMQLEKGFNAKEEEMERIMKQNSYIIEELAKEKAQLEDCLLEQRNTLEEKFAREKLQLEKRLQDGTELQKQQLLEEKESLQRKLEEDRQRLEERLKNDKMLLENKLEENHQQKAILEESKRNLIEELNNERDAFTQRLKEEAKNFEKKIESLNEKRSELEQERDTLQKKLEAERKELDVRLAEDKHATMRRLEARFQLEREDMQNNMKELQKQLKDAQVQLEEKEKDLQDKEYQIRREFQEELDAVNVLDQAVTKDQKDSLAKDYYQVMDSELQCSVCAEIFIDPVLLNCSHSFCKGCIEQWRKTHRTCPNCRNPITCVMPQRTLNNFIDQAIAMLSDDQKKRRQEVIKEREELIRQAAATTVAAQNTAATQRNSRRGRGQRGTTRGRRSRATTANSRASRTQTPGTSTNPIVLPPSPPNIEEEDTDWVLSSPSTLSSSDRDSSESEDGLEGVYYGGYGRCFSCGRRGHWATGCPYF